MERQEAKFLVDQPDIPMDMPQIYLLKNKAR